MRHGTCFHRRLSARHAGAAPHSAVAELGVVRRRYPSPMNESLPKSPAVQKHKLRRYIISFVFVFFAVFYIANSSPSIMLATGANSTNIYGWPSAWLRLHTYATHGFIGDHWEHEFRFEGADVTSWGACVTSVAACGSIATALVAAPAIAHRLFFSSTSKTNDRNA